MKPEFCERCGYPVWLVGTLHKHHLSYGRDEKAVFICKKCHQFLHDGYLGDKRKRKFRKLRDELHIN